MHVLITGGAGFIGSHFAEYHLARGDQVTVIDDLSTGSLENIGPFCNNPLFQFEKADILNCPNLKTFVARADRIYHMVAIVGIYHVLANPMAVLSTNIESCEKLVSAVQATGLRPRVIIMSSSSVYGHSESSLLNEEDDLIIKSLKHPLRNYAISKITSEAIAIGYYQSANIPITIIRLFNTIGPRQSGLYGMVVPRFIEQACTGEPITVFGDGTQTRSFCDVRDVITAVNLLADQPKSIGETVNVGHDSEIQIKDLAELIKQKSNSQSIIKHLSYQDAYGEKLTDISQRRPDLTKLTELTGFRFAWPLERTIEELIESFTSLLRLNNQ